MNRKLLLALILPLMLIPMTSFAYAHWTDKVTKQIKLHAGTVEVEIIQWHIDECNSYDVDCNGIIFGDELIVDTLMDADGQVIEVLITADPVYPSWRLVFKMLIHNKGRLVARSYMHHWDWIGPVEDEPDWLVTQPYPDGRTVPPHLDYTEELRLHNDALFGSPTDPVSHPDGPPCTNKDHYTVVVEPTTYILKPSQCVLVYEEITFNAQDDPLKTEAQCHWFRLAKELVFFQETGDTWSSDGWTKP